MMFFQQMEGHAAIIIENGIFKQTDLYRRGNRLFAKVGGGFVRLMADGSTTKAKARLETISIDTPLYRSTFGHLLLDSEDGAKPLNREQISHLIAAPEPQK